MREHRRSAADRWPAFAPSEEVLDASGSPDRIHQRSGLFLRTAFMICSA